MAMNALSAGGFRIAIWIELKPVHDSPNMPTLPVDLPRGLGDADFKGQAIHADGVGNGLDLARCHARAVLRRQRRGIDLRQLSVRVHIEENERAVPLGKALHGR